MDKRTLEAKLQAKEAKERHKMLTGPLETPEFVEWFEYWNGAEDFANNLEVSDKEKCDFTVSYFKERNFALIGWLACMNPDKRMNTIELLGDEYAKRAKNYINKIWR